MKRKLKAVCVATLVLALQLFSVFVPGMTAAAAEADVTTTSFSLTTIYSDLVDPEIYASGKTPAEIEAGEREAASVLLEKYPLDSTKGTDGVNLIASVVEPKGDDFYVYFYVYVPGGTGSALSANFTLKAGDRTLYKSARQLDETSTLIKYRVLLSKSEYAGCKTVDGYELTVLLFDITYSNVGSTVKVTYTPLNEDYQSGSVRSDIRFVYDSNGNTQNSTVQEQLRLDVHMACERYSQTNAALWRQLNTAYFVVPKEYIDAYNRVFSVSYKYRLLEDVPMLVSTDKDFMEKLKEYEQIDFHPQTTDWSDPVTRWIINELQGNKLNLGPYFRFTVDDISHDEGEPFDVSDDDIWNEYERAYEFAKNLYFENPKFLYAYICGGLNPLPSYDYTKWQLAFCANVPFEYFFINDVLKLPYDLYQVVDFAEREYSEIVSSGDSAASENFWQRFLDGRLLDKIEDDSVDVPAIQEASVKSVLAMSDDEIASTYCLDSKYVDELRSVLSTVSEEDQVVFFHCIETYYYACPPDYILLFDWFDSELMLENQGYYVLNTFILDFNVIDLHFNEGEISVPVIHKSVNFVGGLESPDAMEDEIVTSFTELVGDALQAFWQIVRIILVVLVVVILVIVALKGVATFRDAFGKRR